MNKILQFNESTQTWRLKNKFIKNKSLDAGWIDLSNKSSIMEFKVFSAYVKKKKIKFITNEHAVELYNEMKCFIEQLIDRNLIIEEI